MKSTFTCTSLSLPTENLAISFPEEDEIPEDAQDLVHQLMCFDPMYRLGSTAREGVAGVKSHPFFNNIDWTLLLRTKAEFIPQLRGEDDTSYFDGEKLELYFFKFYTYIFMYCSACMYMAYGILEFLPQIFLTVYTVIFNIWRLCG